MTFPLDPGLRAFRAKEPEHVLLPDPHAQPASPAAPQADSAEDAATMPNAPAEDAGSRQARSSE